MRFLLFLMLLIPTLSWASSSEENREGKVAHVGVHGGGYGVGVQAGYFLNSDTRLNLFKSSTQLELLGSEISIEELRLDYQSFVSNSFYYAIGLFYQEFNIKSREINIFSDAFLGDEVYRADVNRKGINALIGNEWQWDSFYLGAEWIGVFIPFSNNYQIDYSASYSDLEDEEFRSEANRDVKKLSQSNFPLFLRLKLGWSF